MCGRCIRKLLTVWKTSSKPSAFTRSRILLRATNVPVRPAPALYITQTHTSQPWRSFQKVMWCVCVCVTCSAPLWDGCPTAAVVSERMQWCQSFLYLRLGCRSLASRGNESVELNVCVCPVRITHSDQLYHQRTLRSEILWQIYHSFTIKSSKHLNDLQRQRVRQPGGLYKVSSKPKIY